MYVCRACVKAMRVCLCVRVHSCGGAHWALPGSGPGVFRGRDAVCGPVPARPAVPGAAVRRAALLLPCSPPCFPHSQAWLQCRGVVCVCTGVRSGAASRLPPPRLDAIAAAVVCVLPLRGGVMAAAIVRVCCLCARPMSSPQGEGWSFRVPPPAWAAPYGALGPDGTFAPSKGTCRAVQPTALLLAETAALAAAGTAAAGAVAAGAAAAGAAAAGSPAAAVAVAAGDLESEVAGKVGTGAASAPALAEE